MMGCHNLLAKDHPQNKAPPRCNEHDVQREDREGRRGEDREDMKKKGENSLTSQDAGCQFTNGGAREDSRW